MKPDPHVLDRNLAALVGRLYVPVLPRPEFKHELELRFLELAARRAGASVPAVGGLWRRVVAATVAAAAILLVYLYVPPEGSREEILSRGAVAWRALPGGAWSERPAGRPFPLEELPFEIETPAQAGVRATSIHTYAQSALLDADTRARVDRDEGGGEVAFELERGALRLERDAAKAGQETPWRVAVGTARAQLDDGVLAAEAVGDGVSLLLVRGTATVLFADGDRLALEPRRSGLLTETGFRPDDSGRGDDETALVVPKEPPARAPARVSDLAAPAEPDSSGASQDAGTEPPIAVVDPASATLVLDVVRVPGVESDELDARVCLLEVQSLPDVVDPAVVTVSPDASGAYALPGLAPGRYRVDVALPGHALWKSEPFELLPGVATRLDVRPSAPTEVRGVVVDPSGVPIARAWVLSEHDSPDQPLGMSRELLMGHVSEIAETDAEGRFSLPLRPGEHILRAAHDEHAVGWSKTIAVAAGVAVEGVRIALQRPARIHGRAERLDGTPWPGVHIVASRFDQARVLPRMSFLAAATDERGEYAIEGLAPGGYAVLLTGGTNPEMRFLDVSGGDDFEVSFTRSFAGVRVFGRLTTFDGEPVVNMGVSLLDKGAESREADSHHYGFADGEGRYELFEIDPGEYEVYLTPDQGKTVTRVGEIEVPEWVAVERDLDVPDRSIEGFVFDGVEGEPLARAIVILTSIEGVDDPGRFVGRLFTDGDGRFEFPYVGFGSYRVTAHSTTSIRGMEYVEPLLLHGVRPEDHPTQVFELVLYAGAVVRTRVVDRNGEPVSGARLEFTNEVGLRIPFSENDLTDASGSHRANGMKPGTWTLRVVAEGYAPAERPLVPHEGELLDVEIRLTRLR